MELGRMSKFTDRCMKARRQQMIRKTLVLVSFKWGRVNIIEYCGIIVPCGPMSVDVMGYPFSRNYVPTNI